MSQRTPSRAGWLLALSCTLVGCGPLEGLRPTPDGAGPMVVIDWDAKPLPELPFPNDLATAIDPDSPTGLRLNFSQEAPTELERRLRRKANDLTGFGLFAPIMVAFEEPLDLTALLTGMADPGAPAEAAVLLIDISPESPEFGQARPLDCDSGRFPIDLPETDLFFDLDPRAQEASFLFETADEDVNGNGLLDPLEDSDNDGLLDRPNTWDGAPLDETRSNLMSCWERQSNSLILQPVLPLLEETRYAVVLTSDLVGEGGDPVRSPWSFVHHTRQTEALAPLTELLPALGRSLDEVAFAWSFTTGRVTGDLHDLRRALDGEGPWAWVSEMLPAGIDEALRVAEDDTGAPYALPVNDVIGPFAAAGLLPGGTDSLMARFYEDYASTIVGGSFTTPWMMTDSDGDGDDSDEWWRLNPVTGALDMELRRVPFTCVLPQRAPGADPAPVVMLGHGQGGTRFQLILLAWAFNRMGLAACGFDFPHHGGAADPREVEEFLPLIEALGLEPLVESFSDARFRDLTNDGFPDSGVDFLVADAFHTRDNFRQGVIDFARFTRVLHACGEGTMEQGGDRAVSCDWDGDGAPDIGAGSPVTLLGVSLGGIHTSVAAAVDPMIEAAVPVIPGGGLPMGQVRSALSGPREAALGRLITPLILGAPSEAGWTLRQLVISGDDDVDHVIGALPEVPWGARVELANLTTGEVHEGHVRPQEDGPLAGTLRIAIAADALSAVEKRTASGMPDSGPEEGVVYQVQDNQGLGDRLQLTIFDESGGSTVIDTFQQEVVHEGLTMAAGSPLIALAEGSGHTRGTPRLRRLVQILSLASEGGDPIAFAPQWWERPVDGTPRRVLVMPTAGDDVVPIANGVALARAAGLYDPFGVDPRYGLSIDDWLIDTGVLHGLEEYGPWRDAEDRPILFDPDDLDEGLDPWGAPSEAPLRLTRPDDTGGLRIIYSDPRGSHGWGIPDEESPFDINTFATLQAAWFLASRGQLSDDPCLAVGDCDFFP